LLGEVEAEFFCHVATGANDNECWRFSAMKTVSVPLLVVHLPEEAVAGFASLLQHGMLFAIDRPVAILPFLLALPGFSAEYIEKTVQTIFINGVAADSLDRTLSAGSTLALSAAMPGLAGAIFRRQGMHGSLRSQPAVTVQPNPAVSGFITLKLFNSIAADRVRDLLIHGIHFSGKALHDFAARQEHLFQPPVVISFNGRQLRSTDLLASVAGCPIVKMQASVL
jgi:hypothetical protein